MKLLLDTHILLWTSAESPRLSAAARKLILNETNELIFSVASIWETAIKHGKGYPDFDADPAVVRNALLESGYIELHVAGPHATRVASLPPIHKDPFDRLLIAQAMVEGITLLTADATIARYPGPIRKV
jgi:PIN domain nuclease of toxin-antitoxin system